MISAKQWTKHRLDTDRLIGFFNAVNNTLNNDLALAQQYLVAAPSEMTAFQRAVTELIPSFMG